LIDSLTHPNFDENSEDIKLKLTGLGYQSALAVPLPYMTFDLAEYSERCYNSQFYYPVGLYQPHSIISIGQQIELIKKNKCIAIKVHPRFSNWDWTSPSEAMHLGELFSICESYDLPIMFCCYFSCEAKNSIKRDPIYIFQDLMEKYPNLKIIFMHGGGHRILDFIELTRFNKNSLIDLSFTILKFHGSSIDLDIGYALRLFQNKIVLGTDAPYCNPDEVWKKIATYFDDGDVSGYNLRNHPVFGSNLRAFLSLQKEL
jgi:predicted TIM-barrel fold metal-dependent hydrolase